MAWRNLCLVAALAVTGVLAAENLIDAPEKLKLERATYRKITIKWEYPADGTQIASYRIYRDGKEISRSPETAFTDTGVEPGKYYEYRVDAITTGGKSSDLSVPLKVKTFDSVDFAQHEQVESVVDSLHDMPVENLTALSLFSAVKAGLESLTGSSLTSNTLDSELVSRMITGELEWIKAAAPDWTDAERIAAQAELDRSLKEDFAGNSMEQVYMYDRLTSLAEDHWGRGNKHAATALYEFSLKFLRNHEDSVSNTLNRLAAFKTADLTAESSAAEIELALAASRTERFRLFDFFPDAVGKNVRFVYTATSTAYFKYFPKLFSYDDYREQAYHLACASAAKQDELFPNAHSAKRLEQFRAWQLIRVKVKLHDAAGNPRRGSIKVANVTADTKPELFPDEPYYEERTFAIDGEAEIPVYAGHVYEITARITIPGGSDLIMTLPSFPQQNDQQIVYDTHGNPVQTPSTNGPTAEIVVADSDFPYNLKFERNIDVFTLSWDWLDTTAFKAAGFKVFNGDTLVATVTGNSAANIRLAAPDGNYTYTVAAFDANGQLSRSSVPVTVEPGDQSAHAEFFAWLEQYFGELPVLSTDDSDGDGVDNYHEFLNGTDPTCAPAPTPSDKQVTYTKISLNWECAPELSEGAVWTIRRDGTEVGTSLTASFTDSGLIPGMEYRYTIRGKFANGTGTDWSAPLQLKTQKPETVAYGDKLQQVVDLFNPIELADYTAPSLISAVKSAVEAVTGANITFTVVDESLLEKLVAAEFELLRESTGSMTAAERLTLRNELSQMMAEDFGGNSFEHMYIQSKLAELAEDHWAAYLADRSKTGSRTAAEALYDASLSFMKDHQQTVYTTLSRLATMQWQALEVDCSREEIKGALTRQRDILLRFFDFFEDVDSETPGLLHPYIPILHNYYRYFPIMLAYENYDRELFDSAMQIRNALAAVEVRMSVDGLLKRIAAWNLVPLTISGEAAGAAAGTLTFRNVSERLNYSLVGEGFTDIRTVQLTAGQQELPVYGGHWYELELVTPVNGGPDWKRVIGPLFFPAGEKVVYDSFAGIRRETLPAGTAGATLALKLEQPLAPYNLKAEKLPDALTLSWDWAAPEGFTLDHFKVYRGDTVVGTSATQTLAGIPRVVAEDAAYAYTVTAVSASGTETRRSPALQVLPDFTEEEKAYFEWKFKYFGDTPTLATDDPDGDGLSNYQEFLLGSNPIVAPPKTESELNVNKQPGSIVKYYSGSWNKLPDFAALLPIRQEIRTTYNFSNTAGIVLNSTLTDSVGMTIDGYFDLAESGHYQFVLSSNDGAKFSIDGREIIKNDRQESTLEYFADAELKAGIHSYRIEYFERTGSARFELFWTGKDFTRIPFEQNGHWHINASSPEFQEFMIWKRDTDGDGLRDAEELKFGTDRFNADSDGDGLEDGEEINKYKTDPLKQDSDNDGIPDGDMLRLFDPDNPAAHPTGLETILRLKPADFISSLGNWETIQNRFLISSDIRGELTYAVSLPEDNIYRIRITFSQHFPLPREVKLKAYLDECFLGDVSTELGANSGELIVYTPWTLSGKHKLRLQWDGHRREVILQLSDIEFQKINGPDLDHNQKADWIDSYLAKTETVVNLTESRISPACLEGRTKYMNLLKLNGASQAITGGAGYWFANVPLDPFQATPLELSFQNGGYKISGNVHWLETNLLTENNQIFTIRKNDSLKLNVHPIGIKEGSYRIKGLGQDVSNSVNTPYVLLFPTVGEFVIGGEYFNAQQQSAGSGSITVRVVEYDFPDMNPALWIGRLRSWDTMVPAAGVLLKPTKNIALFEKSSTLANGQIRYRLGTNDDKEAGIIARIENGPIIAMAAPKPFALQSSGETYVACEEHYEDGTRLYEMPIIVSPVLPDTEVRVRIFVAGVLFDDGTTEKRLRPEDFDERGICRVYFLKHAAATTSVCHTLQVYQNNIYVGIRH